MGKSRNKYHVDNVSSTKATFEGPENCVEYQYYFVEKDLEII